MPAQVDRKVDLCEREDEAASVERTRKVAEVKEAQGSYAPTQTSGAIKHAEMRTVESNNKKLLTIHRSVLAKLAQ